MEPTAGTQPPTVTFIAVRQGVPRPVRATTDAAGHDLRAAEGVTVEPQSWRVVPTGYRCRLPEGWAGLVCPRSGLAARQGVTVLNAPGVVDADFDGEVAVILANHGPYPVTVERGDRIAQLVAVPCMTGADRSATQRRGGFGSTGVK